MVKKLPTFLNSKVHYRVYRSQPETNVKVIYDFKDIYFNNCCVNKLSISYELWLNITCVGVWNVLRKFEGFIPEFGLEFVSEYCTLLMNV